MSRKNRVVPDGYATLAQAAAHRGCTRQTITNYVRNGYMPVYRLPGSKDVVVNIREMDARLATLPPGTIRDAYKTFGPNADIRPLRLQAESVEPK